MTRQLNDTAGNGEATRSLLNPSDLRHRHGTVLVLNGDVPCLRPATLRRFLRYHLAESAAATVLTARMTDPAGYGRIVRSSGTSNGGALLRIVEHKDATDDERAIDEVNSGLFCFEREALFESLARADRDNAQKEYYLTDVVASLREDGHEVRAFCVDDAQEVAGINDVRELEDVRRYFDGVRG